MMHIPTINSNRINKYKLYYKKATLLYSYLQYQIDNFPTNNHNSEKTKEANHEYFKQIYRGIYRILPIS